MLDPDERFYPRFHVDRIFALPKRNLNISPGQFTVAITATKQNRQPELMQWGFIKDWQKKPSTVRIFNTRLESILAKHYYLQAILQNRCLVPATGFYEWQKNPGGKSIPYIFQLEQQKYFSIAALYKPFCDPEGKMFNTFSIITVPATAATLAIHERLPLVLTEAEEQQWLAEEKVDHDKLQTDLHFQIQKQDLLSSNLTQRTFDEKN